MATQGQVPLSANDLEPSDRNVEDLGGVPLPPVICRENLDFTGLGVVRTLDCGEDGPQVGDAVAHHAAVEQDIGGICEAVAEVIA